MFDTDDEDFTFSPSSNLSSIFNATYTSEDTNSSLKYKAPKQPKAPDIPKVPESETNIESKSQPQSTVILAKIITLWKLDKGENKPMGKYMVAIIGNSSRDLYEIIVYQDKTNIIIRETLGKSFTFYKYPNNFVAFYDNQKQLWNLSFDSSESTENFLQHCGNYKCVIINQTEINSKKDVKSDQPNPKLNKEPNSKETILSRITKMGQPILPRTIARTRSSELSDSETESSVSDPMPPKPLTAPRKVKRNLNNNEKALTPILSETHNNFLVPSNAMILNPHNQGVVYSQPMPDYNLSNFIITQNAELKANLVELNAKLNNVLNSSDHNGNSREDVSNLNSKIKCQNLKIDNLSLELDRSRRALEELQKKYDGKCEDFDKEQNRMQQIEIMKVELQKKIQDMELTQNTIQQLKDELKEKEKQLEIRDLKLKDFEGYLKSNESLLKENNDLTQKYEEAVLKLQEIEEEIKQKENNSFNLEKDYINRLVKESMNEAFLSIMECFQENETYDFKQIQKALLENLKKTSYRLMSSLLEKKS